MACASAFMKYHGRLQSFWREWESAHLEYTATQENHGMISILSPSILSDSLLPMKGGSRYDRFRLLVHDCESHFSQTVKEPAWKNNSSLSLSLSPCVDDRQSGLVFALACFLWGFYFYHLLVLYTHGCLSCVC